MSRKEKRIFWISSFTISTLAIIASIVVNLTRNTGAVGIVALAINVISLFACVLSMLADTDDENGDSESRGLLWRVHRLTSVDVYLPLIILSLLPVLLLVSGVCHLFAGYVYTPMMVIMFFILPIATIFTLFLILSSVVSGGLRTLGMTLTAIVAFNLFFAAALMSTLELIKQHTGDELTEKYADVTEYSDYMPSLDEIEGASDARYQYYYVNTAFSTYKSDTLILEYSADEYERAKEKLFEGYVFEDEPIDSCLPYVTVGDFDFRMLDTELVKFPYAALFVGTSDKTHEIVFISVRYGDRISLYSLDYFITDCCGFKYLD